MKLSPLTGIHQGYIRDTAGINLTLCLSASNLRTEYNLLNHEKVDYAIRCVKKRRKLNDKNPAVKVENRPGIRYHPDGIPSNKAISRKGRAST